MKKNSIFSVVFVVVFFVCQPHTFAQRTGGFNEINLDDGAGAITYVTTSGGSLGVNGLDLLPNPCAILDLNSTTKGFLMPRMNTAQRDALCPIPGMAVFNISTNSFDYYNGGSWATLASTSSWIVTGNNNVNVDGVDNLFGTVNTSPLYAYQFIVGGNRIMRYETNNRIIGGDVGNTISGASNYAVIAGGGAPGFTNSITGGDYGTIGGGGANVVSAQTGTVAGGGYNRATALRSTVAGGAGNTASGQGAFVGGGETGSALGANNTASGDNSVVVGGVSNLASGIGSFIGGGGFDGGSTGGNIASGNASTIGGGMINTVASTYGTIAGGRNNSTSAAAAVAMIGGGAFNSATAAYAVVVGGNNNTASGQESFVGGGTLNQAVGGHSFVPGGVYGVASHEGEFAHASGSFAAAGDAQTSVLVARNETTNATASELFLDGIGSRATIPASTTWSFRTLVTGKTAAGASAGYQIVGLIENIGGTTGFVGVPTVTVLGEDVAAWDCVATADNANDALAVTVTGAAATTIRWVARIDLTQVTF